MSREIGVALLEDGADTLLDLPLDRLSDEGVVTMVTALEAHRRKLAAFEHDLYAQVMTRHIKGAYAEQSLVDVLVPLLQITPAEARARASRATDLSPRHALTGENLPRLMPITADAARAGRLSDQHAAVIAKALDAIPAEVAHDMAPIIEGLLVDTSAHEHPKQLERTAKVLLNRVDPNGTEPSDDEIDRNRFVSLRRSWDGMVELRGRVTPETAAVIDAVFDSLAAPSCADGEPDPRTAGQRRHDALHDTFMRVLRSGTLPTAGGTPVTVLIQTTVDDLAESAASAAFGVSGHGHLIRLSRLANLGLAEADLLPIYLRDNGAILNLGRTRRLASCAQRRALTARDRGCCFPGCERPAAWCEVHHVREWTDGGRTDIDNMCLLCPYHHRTFEAQNWVLRMRDGVPEWTPPAWLDPQHRPRRNTAHHPPYIAFRCPELMPV